MRTIGGTGDKPSGENIFQSDTTTWNISEGFSKINVLKIIVEINLFEVMAKFGKQDLEEELPETVVSYRRISGFDRMMFSLRQIISNCMFRIEWKDLEKMRNLIERINLVESVSDGISTEFVNDLTKETTLVINEEHFRKCLDSLSKVKEELHFILDHAGLIYRKTEETDIEDFMKSVYEG